MEATATLKIPESVAAEGPPWRPGARQEGRGSAAILRFTRSRCAKDWRSWSARPCQRGEQGSELDSDDCVVSKIYVNEARVRSASSRADGPCLPDQKRKAHVTGACLGRSQSGQRAERRQGPRPRPK
jgi:hypothetical protein